MSGFPLNFDAKKFMEEHAARIAQAGVADANALAIPHLKDAVDGLRLLAVGCPDPKVRLDSQKTMINMGKDYLATVFSGPIGAFDALIGMPQAEQYDVLLQLYGRKQATKAEIEFVLKIIDAKAVANNTALVDELATYRAQLDGDPEPQGRAPTKGKTAGKKTDVPAPSTVLQ